MKAKGIVNILLILAVVFGVYYFFFRAETPDILPETEMTQEEERQFEDAFNLEIPDDIEKILLEDVTGGDTMAIATREYEGGLFSHTVLADLSDPLPGTFYEGWLVIGEPGDANFHFISTGKMRVAKGGYLLEFESSTDYSDHLGVVITLEEVFDATPEKHILEGSF